MLQGQGLVSAKEAGTHRRGAPKGGCGAVGTTGNAVKSAHIEHWLNRTAAYNGQKSKTEHGLLVKFAYTENPDKPNKYALVFVISGFYCSRKKGDGAENKFIGFLSPIV